MFFLVWDTPDRDPEKFDKKGICWISVGSLLGFGGHLADSGGNVMDFGGHLLGFCYKLLDS